jgi:hypothetical protein
MPSCQTKLGLRHNSTCIEGSKLYWNSTHKCQVSQNLLYQRAHDICSGIFRPSYSRTFGGNHFPISEICWEHLIKYYSVMRSVVLQSCTALVLLIANVLLCSSVAKRKTDNCYEAEREKRSVNTNVRCVQEEKEVIKKKLKKCARITWKK